MLRPSRRSIGDDDDGPEPSTARWRAQSHSLACTDALDGDAFSKLAPPSRLHSMSESANSTVHYLPRDGRFLLREKAARLAQVPDVWSSPLPNLHIAHLSVGSVGLPICGPNIVVVCGGEGRVRVGSHSLGLQSGEALIVCVPLELVVEPQSFVTDSLVVLAIHLDLTVVAEMLLALKEPRRTIDEVRRNVALSIRNEQIIQAVNRLLDLCTEPREVEILGPAVLREIHFRALTGECGNAVRGALGRNGRVAKIGRVLRRIHAEFHSQLSAETLAEEACMCLTAFHENFRAVTGSTPLQYLKSVRLHTARMLMLREGISAAAASSRVGYESPSQFSREFKREFGKTPAQVAREAGLDAAASGVPPSRLRRGSGEHRANLLMAPLSPDSQFLARSELACAENRAGSGDRKPSPRASGRLDL